MEKQIEKELYRLALKAYKKDEIPVSAIIVKNNKIIAKAFNKKNINHSTFLHAEIICIKKACRKLHRWNLNDCSMFVTLKPCNLCKEAIEESRIKQVFYILDKGKITNKYTKTEYKQMYDIANLEEINNLMKKTFKKLRK